VCVAALAGDRLVVSDRIIQVVVVNTAAFLRDAGVRAAM
jgi:hypothetical protein